MLPDERDAWPAVNDAEVHASTELVHQMLLVGVILPFAVPFVAETYASCVLSQFYA